MERKWMVRILRTLCVMGLLLLALSPASAVNSASAHSDAALFTLAQNAYQSGRWVDAARYLTAYVERDPDAMRQIPGHAQQVQAALSYSLDRIRIDRENLEVEIRQAQRETQNIMDQCTSQCRNVAFIGSSVSGLTEADPPPGLGAPSAAAAHSYPLICRGGGALHFTLAVSSPLSSKPHILIAFKRSPYRAGFNGENLSSLGAGACAWVNRPVGANEPDTVLLREPWLPADQLSLRWGGGGAVQLNPPLDYLQTLQSAPDRYEALYVYNDSQGHFVATGRGLVLGPIEVESSSPYRAGHAQLNGIGVGAHVYTDREYTYRAVPSLLQGATYLQTANEDKWRAGDQFLSFKINRPATVYVAHDRRYAVKPAWLSAFKASGQALVFVANGEIVILDLYQKEVAAGVVVLGGNVRAGERGNNGMYTVIVRP